MKKWNTLELNLAQRLERARIITNNKYVSQEDIVRLLELVIEPGDKICIEGNNQKHADFLSQSLAAVNNQIIHDLHIVQSNIALPAHLDIFEKKIAKKLDFCYSGEQGVRLGKLIKEGLIEVGAIHTYLELYSRYFVDLTPRVSFIAAQSADPQGNLYTGPNTEDTHRLLRPQHLKMAS
jgi:malonate decarboxylase alpha subunit